MLNQEAKSLAKTGAVIGLCPITEANLGDGIFNGEKWLKEGGKFGVGTDSNVKISLFEELRTLEYSQRLKNKNQYKHDNEWLPIKSKKEVFSVKGKNDTAIYVRSTHHGPIVTDIHHLAKSENTVLSMAWTGHWITNELDAWVELTTMKDWNDFSNALSKFGVPGQNIVYADIDGNIGWRPAVYIPIRKAGFSMVPRPGWNSTYDWDGMVPYEDMPFMYNPESGYIATANNRTIDMNFPYYISGLWADPSRASR